MEDSWMYWMKLVGIVVVDVYFIRMRGLSKSCVDKMGFL